MDLGSIFLLLALIVLVALFISRPLSERRSLAVSDEERIVSTLLAERDHVLSALSELDFDHKLGRVPAEAYPAQRAALLQRGAQVLQELDAHQAGAAGGPDATRDALEAAIAARRAELAEMPQDDVEAMIAAHKESRSVAGTKFCPNCGEPVQSGDRFCVNCGASLA